MTRTYYDPKTLPRPGDVVWCRFPFRDMPGHPGPKPRPAIVRAVFLDRRRSRSSVEVAFGASKKTGRLYRGAFSIASPSGMRAAGFEAPTKFDLARTVWLPWTREFFTSKPGRTRLILASLHPSDTIALLRTAMSLLGT